MAIHRRRGVRSRGHRALRQWPRDGAAGVSDYEGARLGIFFADQTVLSDQLSSRRAGQIGSYRTIVKRASDDALIPVPVTGIPMTNERGQIVGSFAVLRLPLQEEINRLHQEAGDPNSVLFRVMQELQKVIPLRRGDGHALQRRPAPLPDLLPLPTACRQGPRRIEQAVDADAAGGEGAGRRHTDEAVRRPRCEAYRRGSRHMRNGAVVRALLEEGVQICIRRPSAPVGS